MYKVNKYPDGSGYVETSLSQIIRQLNINN